MSSFNNNGAYTTTPFDREGPPAPFSSPAIQANLFFRVFLGLLALPVIWVPMQVLRRNSEFAGVVFCAVTMFINFLYAVNALIWPNDDVHAWPAGYGWCDLEIYIFFALDTVYNVSLFEIMRNLASKVALRRATSLSAAERRRKRFISAAVIFTFPLLQVISTYFVLLRRYNVSTLVGCTPVYAQNVLFLVFFVIPSPCFTLCAGFLAGTCCRFWAVVWLVV